MTSVTALTTISTVSCSGLHGRPKQGLAGTPSCATLASHWRNGTCLRPASTVGRPQVRRISAQSPRAWTESEQSQREAFSAARNRGAASVLWEEEAAESSEAAHGRRPSGPGWLRGAVIPALTAAALALTLGAAPPPVLAADALKTCACLLQDCRGQFFRCLADPGCAANVACLQTCNNRPDETECQIGCGDLFENAVVDEFNKCAVSDKKCVPQKPDTNLYPVPPPDAVVPRFDMRAWEGTWFISAGLNQTFDTFDCQEHLFSAGGSQIEGNLKWRIATPEGGFFTRSAKQMFVQDKEQPGLLLNHGNEFLHYEDDWYILASKTEGAPDDYILVYYRGRNDAWDGYGGAVIYTRSRTLPSSVKPEIQNALQKVGLSLNKFKETDNSCRPQAPLLARLEKTVERVEEAVVEEVQELEQEVVAVTKKEGEFFANIARAIFGEVVKDEEALTRELGEEERRLLEQFGMGVQDIERLFSKPVPVRKIRSGGVVLPASAQQKQGQPTVEVSIVSDEQEDGVAG